MTFREKVKRFLEPVWHDPKVFFQSFLEGSTDWLYLIAILYFFEKIGWSLQDGNQELFAYYLILYSCISFLYFFLKTLMIHWWWVNIYASIDTFAAKKYLWAFIHWEPNIVERIGTGRFLQIYKTGTRNWMETFHNFLNNDFAFLLSSIYGIIRISSLNIIYGLGIIGILFFVVIVMYLLDKNYTIPYRKRRVETETEYGRILARVFMSKMEYLQTGEFENERKRISNVLEDIKVQNYAIDNSVWGMYIFVRALGFFFRMVVYIYVGKAIFDGTANFWIFSTYILIITLLETTLRNLYDTFRRLTRDGQHIIKLWETFDSILPIEGYSTWSPFTPENKNIEIEQVTYGYTESKVFENFSLTIEKGKKTALVWASGGGKTTLIKLIAGYLHPESGSISVLGNPLGSSALKTYYPHIGYLTQDPSVFDGTIRENLISALPSLQRGMPEGQGDFVPEKNPQSRKLDSSFSKELQENKLIEALCLAHCDFVFELEKGLDTEIGERGVRLSWGQKQRLAIAKIFLKDPEIILLDEPTSALDSFSEEKITEALNTLFQWRTVIIVAHRLQTVKKADDIIVIEWGSIVERGTHTTLVEQGGIYARMLELQSGF